MSSSIVKPKNMDSRLQHYNIGRRVPVRWALCCLTLVIAGCSTLAPKPAEVIVEERALAQAVALQQGDYKVALTYTTPTYQNSAAARRYANDRANTMRWQSVEVSSVACEPADEPVSCDVRLLIQTRLPPLDIGVITVPLDYQWLKLGVDWYQYVE